MMSSCVTNSDGTKTNRRKKPSLTNACRGGFLCLTLGGLQFGIIFLSTAITTEVFKEQNVDSTKAEFVAHSPEI